MFLGLSGCSRFEFSNLFDLSQFERTRHQSPSLTSKPQQWKRLRLRFHKKNHDGRNSQRGSKIRKFNKVCDENDDLKEFQHCVFVDASGYLDWPLLLQGNEHFLIFNLIRPAILALAKNTGSSVGSTGYIFVARSIGYLIGSGKD